MNVCDRQSYNMRHASSILNGCVNLLGSGPIAACGPGQNNRLGHGLEPARASLARALGRYGAWAQDRFQLYFCHEITSFAIASHMFG